jgi:hypothetical protein
MVRRTWALAALALAACHTTTRAGGGDDAGAAPVSADVPDAGSSLETFGEIEQPDDTPPQVDSWEDPVALAGLAVSCDWTPWHDDEEKANTSFSCLGDMPQQSCTYDPCHDKADGCKPGCATACEGCDAACGKACGACEAGCHEEACRAACAKTTASCKMTCAQRRDRCVTAKCDAAYADCRAPIDELVKTHDCDKACPALNRCSSACAGADDTCYRGCKKRFAAQCPGELATMCLSNGPWMSEEEIRAMNGAP